MCTGILIAPFFDVPVYSLPGVALPENVVAVPDVIEAIKGATYLIFVLPHQCKSPIPRSSSPSGSKHRGVRNYTG